MEVLPAELHPHVDAIDIEEDGTLAVASSALTGRTWNGSLWLFKDRAKAPDVHYCSAGCTTESGTTDIKWIDSRRLVLGSDSGTVDIWCLSGSFQSLENMATLTDHDNTVSSVSVDCIKSKIVSGSWDRSIKLWDIEHEKCIKSYKGHRDMVWSAVYSRTEQDLFVSVSQDGKVILWDARTPKLASKLTDSSHDSIPRCVDWSPLDNHLLAIGYEDGTVCLCNIQDPKQPVLSYCPHERAVNKLAFSPRSPEWLATVSDDMWVHKAMSTQRSCEAWHGVPVDDTLYTSGWGQQIFSHAFECVSLRTLTWKPVNRKPRQSAWIMDAVNQAHFNGDVNGASQDDDNVEETMEVDRTGTDTKDRPFYRGNR
ncbi:Methylosome protein 50 [Desmophyllum pertusum]|uniref:Methylosome protein 50 n=1 Tax=Desmophyllum pertusum TaxID=174260 RepID=A0A9X0D1P9_9CNID|nr:Methylosome protein 50 [Desmophyllum pertusum]